MRKLVTYLSGIFAICLFLMSCMTMPTETIVAKETYYIVPELGIRTTVYIGDPLIREGITTEIDAIFLKNVHGTWGLTAYHPVGVYKQVGKAGGFVIYQGSTLEINGWTSVYPQILEDINGNVYLKGNLTNELLPPEEFEKKKHVEDSENNFEQTLIYTGAEGTVLKFSYREFLNNTARPAFSVDATYDIEEDKVIRFKGASLEVISVDNQSITYKLLSGFKS